MIMTVRSWLWALALGLSSVWTVPIAAQDLSALTGGDAADEPAEADAPAQAIDDTQDAGADERIAARLSDIYGEIDAYDQVRVAVSSGVVRLSGIVPTAGDIDDAAGIAERIDGVVTVSNGLERDVSVGEGLGAVGKIAERARAFLAMLPLIALALGVALAIGAVGYIIAGLGSLWRRIAPNSFLAELIASAIRFVFIVGGIVIALDMIGATALLGAVLGGAGLIGVALGFAMRDTIENYVASLMLSLRQPFRANDHVLIDDMEGRIVRLTSRATVMMTLDGNHLRIPNSTVFKAVILNYTRNPQRRFAFEMGIDADDDPNAARRVGRDILSAMPFVLDSPPPEARVQQVGDSNIVIEYLAWIDQNEADWFKARSRAIAAVKTGLEDGGFALPEPIYRLRFDGRTDPLPFENIAKALDGEEGEAPRATDTSATNANRTPAAKPAAPIAAEDEIHDVKPVNDIVDMVEAERSATGDADLLDSNRPVE